MGNSATTAERTRSKNEHFEQKKRPKEVPLREHTSLGPKATAPITVICLSPDLTRSVEQHYSGGNAKPY